MAPGLFWEGTPKLCAYLLPRYNSFCAPPVQSLYRFIVFPYRLFYNRNNRAKAGYKQPVGASCGPREILSTRKFISNPNHKSSGKAGSSRQCLMFISLSYLKIKKNKRKPGLFSPGQCASTRGFEPPTPRLGGECSILLSYVDVY